MYLKSNSFIHIVYLFQTNIKMKNRFLLLLAPAIIFLASCGGTKKEETVSLPGMKQVDITINGNALTVIVPDFTKGPLQIVEKPWGATEISVGTDFQISIEEGPGDIALLKSDIAADDVYKLQKFITDNPKLVFWEVKILDMEGTKFHFYNIVPAGKTTYIVKDIETGESYSQTAVQKMIDAAQTLAAKEVKAPDA